MRPFKASCASSESHMTNIGIKYRNMTYHPLPTHTHTHTQRLASHFELESAVAATESY